MTTKSSSLKALKAQADKIASVLKAAERGESVDTRFAEKIAAARNKESFKFGVVMDDKIVSVEMPWATVRETDEAGLSEWIVRQMRESQDPLN
jgi:hypothetical protein